MPTDPGWVGLIPLEGDSRMICVKCDRLVRLGVYVVTGEPDKGMICWPCHLEGEEE